VNLQTDIFPANLRIILTEARQITVVSHENPDGDAVSSATAVFNYFSSKFSNCRIVMPNDFPDFLKKIPGSSKIINHRDSKAEVEKILAESDVIICTDFNDEKRVGKLSESLKTAKALKIMLDHHPSPSGFAEYFYSDIEACSASEVVFEFLKKFDSDFLNQEIAECIFTGIMTDTICFSVNASRPRTFEITAELLALGIEKDRIYGDVFNQFSENRVRLSGYLFNQKMIIFKDLKAAYVVLTKEDQSKYGFQSGDSEGFVNIPLSISGINVSIFMQEKTDHFKLSLRSRNGIDVNLMARKYFDGGGHKYAAGGRIYAENVIEAEKKLIEIMKNYLTN
jgi:phosphoesterase RecJ-like protein